MTETKARLVLQDGSEYSGVSIGYQGNVAGEVVFNTGMVGYPESFTDPSYKGQILVLTYPLIGNYGVPDFSIQENFESDKIHISGLIISDYAYSHNHWNSKMSLQKWLIDNKIPALAEIDTRALTKKLREHGNMLGKILFFDNNHFDFEDPNKRNLVAEVSCKDIKEYGSKDNKKIILIDCGMKNNILRNLLKRDFFVKRVPWDYNFLNENFDAVFISNGPGDPKQCKITIEHLKKAIELKKPIFGICMGNQLLALAAGADTYKLKYGHRSQNQPCILTGTKRCFITSQNHGYAVDEKTMPEGWKVWFSNANDGTVEGIKHETLPFFGFQAHPEASPGPSDTEFLFDEFVERIKNERII